MRVFIGIELDEETQNKLSHIQEQLKACSERGNFTAISNLHLTVQFIGEIGKEHTEKLKHLVDKIASAQPDFELVLDSIGEFPKKNRHILWMGIRQNNTLTALYQQVTDSLDEQLFGKDIRPYRPHITLGRQVRLKEPFEAVAQQTSWSPMKMRISHLTLFESTRVNGKLAYVPIYRQKLKKESK